MGICASCLGLSRSRDMSDEDESSRLLFDDAHANHYGSFGDPNTGLIQQDPQEVQRETEALQRVVTHTSNHLVDIFAMVPQATPRALRTIFSNDARSLRYKDVLTKISVPDQSSGPSQHPHGSFPNMSNSWMSEEDDTRETKSSMGIKAANVGPLLGGFEDVESAMK